MAFDLSTARPVEETDQPAPQKSQGGFDISTARPVQEPAGPQTMQTDAQPAAQQQPAAGQEQRQDYGAAAAPLEFMAAFNRGATKLADFLTTDQINAVAEVLGSEFRVPSITETAGAATQGNFMEPGTARDIVRGAGEVIPAAVGGGAGLTQAAGRLPASAGPAASRVAAQQAGGRAAVAPVAAPAESTAAGVTRQLGAAAPAADVGYGAASGAGAAAGREEGGEAGAAVGAILAPLLAAGAGASLKGLLDAGAAGVRALARSVDDMSEEGAATLLADAMVREGLGPDDVARQLADLGPEALPADVGTNFARLLRTASNIVPRVEGEAGRTLAQRQAGQGDRVASAFDDATGIPRLSLDDEIKRIERAFKPEIDRLYAAAREKSEQVLGGPRPTQGYSFGSPHLQQRETKLQQLLAGENIGGPAQAQAQRELTAKRLSGEPVTKLDQIDATKRAIDDQINSAMREGQMGKARSFIKLKNSLVSEADRAIPEYKQGRQLFAGKATLENAAEMGQEFFKMKPRDVADTVRNMGDSEKRMFRLGAKQALIDKLDTMQITRDKVKALFGRGGDAEKLRFAFESPQQFRQFSEAMQREANFIRTRRAAQANSTTAKQLFDESASFDALETARSAAGDPVAAASQVGRIFMGLKSKKGSEANTRALEMAGDILLERGMNPEKIVSVLKRGSEKEVSEALKRVAPTAVGAARRGALTGTAVEQLPAPDDAG